jgi:hypothetical protein
MSLSRSKSTLWQELCVPITPFLRERTFDPEDVTIMSSVFRLLCCRLALTDKADPATLLVAEKVIELAAAGRHDEPDLRAAALRAFGLSEYDA